MEYDRIRTAAVFYGALGLRSVRGNYSLIVQKKNESVTFCFDEVDSDAVIRWMRSK